MGIARERIDVELDFERAVALWTDTRRWPSFVDGFARLRRVDGEWPEEGSRVEWESRPGGRGTVTEKALEYDPNAGRLVTQVFEEALQGRLTASFARIPEGGTAVDVQLDYRLTQAGVFRRIADVLFIRRALTDSLRRTLVRYAREADEEASL